MKRYYNSTTKEWYTEGQSMTRRIQNGVFAGVPSTEQLAEWGFVEVIDPEPTQEQQLARAKREKTKALERYDKSRAVNSFTINGQQMWLTVDERQQIATQISANEAVGRETMTRWFHGTEFTFPIATWKQMLTALEVYAGDALNVTEAHKAAVEALETIEAVEEYDFTTGYPAKLHFGETYN